MARKTTSLKIDEEIWREFKIKCIAKQINLSDKLEEILRKEVKK